MKLLYSILILLSINVQGQIINESFSVSQQLLENRCWIFYGSTIENAELTLPPSSAVRTPFMQIENEFTLRFNYNSLETFVLFLVDSDNNLILLDFIEGNQDPQFLERTYQITGNYALYIESFGSTIDNFSISGLGFNTCIPLAIKIGSPIKKGDFIEFESFTDKGRYIIQRSTDGKNWQNFKIIGAIKGLQKVKLK
jgi:hypothetical protein